MQQDIKITEDLYRNYFTFASTLASYNTPDTQESIYLLTDINTQIPLVMCTQHKFPIQISLSELIHLRIRFNKIKFLM